MQACIAYQCIVDVKLSELILKATSAAVTAAAESSAETDARFTITYLCSIANAISRM